MIIRIEDPKKFEGLALIDACQAIQEQGYSVIFKQTPSDGYDPLRVKLQIENGLVKKAEIG